MRMNKRARVLISAAFTLLLYLTMLSQRLFEAIDNYGAAMEIAGCFGADRVFVHISPSYCKLLGWISDLLGGDVRAFAADSRECEKPVRRGCHARGACRNVWIASYI